MTRDEHLRWCKDRAMEYVRDGDLTSAVASMMSDLGKHEATTVYTKGAVAQLGLLAAMQATQGDRQAVERYILGFH